MFLIQEPTCRLIQDILFDNYVKGLCKSVLAVVFLMRRFPNDTQLYQGAGQSLVSTNSGRSRRTWYIWNSIHRLHCKSVKINGVATPKDLYWVMNRIKELGFSLP